MKIKYCEKCGNQPEKNKLIAVIAVVTLLVIVYSVYWTTSLAEAKRLYDLKEYTKAKHKVETLINPFKNEDIERIKYIGTIAWPYEAIDNLKENSEPDNVSYYRTILENLLDGLKRLRENEVVDTAAAEGFYTYYFLELENYISDIYPIDIHTLEDMSEEEQQIYIGKIAKNIIKQNKLDANKKELDDRLSKDGIKIYPMVNYEEDEWTCSAYIEIDRKARFSTYYDLRVSVTYYDENYEDIQSDSYELDEVSRGYRDTISIISMPTHKTKPYKYSVYVDYYEYDREQYLY